MRGVNADTIAYKRVFVVRNLSNFSAKVQGLAKHAANLICRRTSNGIADTKLVTYDPVKCQIMIQGTSYVCNGTQSYFIQSIAYQLYERKYSPSLNCILEYNSFTLENWSCKTRAELFKAFGFCYSFVGILRLVRKNMS